MLYKNRKGTSLIEAAISIALIGIMLLWAAKIYSNSSKNANTTSNIEIATHLASEKIEYLKTLDKSHIDNISNSSSVVQFSSPYEKFGYKYIVPNSVNGNPNPEEQNGEYIKYIEVEIYLMSDTSNPLIKMECNFLRKSDDGSNIGT
jgi:type II secretory pathway pseudopilin PulG